MVSKDQILLAERYDDVTVKGPTKLYYNSLDSFLRKFSDLHLGPNVYTDTGMVNSSEVGIYRGDEQVGKIERKVKGDKLVLEHIKFYTRRSGYSRRIYDHDLQFAKEHSINVVESELVSEVTFHLFITTFTKQNGWSVIKKGKKHQALRI